VIITKEALPANNWNKILTVPRSGGSVNIPIVITSIKMARDKNLFGFINSNGDIYESDDMGFDKDEKIYFSAFY
jgi:hypothetical protein